MSLTRSAEPALPERGDIIAWSHHAALEAIRGPVLSSSARHYGYGAPQRRASVAGRAWSAAGGSRAKDPRSACCGGRPRYPVYRASEWGFCVADRAGRNVP